jgi:predicted molibdopterin-dependent oxidoreductase YjgC
MLTNKDGGDQWQCEKCKKQFNDIGAKLLVCQRCQKYMFIKCLKKTDAEYKVLTKSDTMWFCAICKDIVEKNIITDLKIEKRCNEFMKSYEDRIRRLEERVEEKCDESRVRDIVRSEMNTI